MQLRTRVKPEEAQRFLGQQGREDDAGLLVRGDATVFKPNGERLLTVLRGAISEDAASRAYPFLHWLRGHVSRNRGAYSGKPRGRTVKEDGTRSNTNLAAATRSVIAGYFDRAPRFPFCRETVFSTTKPKEWGETLPMIQEAADTFNKYVPDRFEKQLSAAKKTQSAYVIPKTPFTTITVNNCVAGGYHRDAGDYKPGFGVMAVFRRGSYKGCELVFPAFGASVDLGDRDLIFFDPHEIHGNTPFFDTQGEEGEDWERISVVMYFREKMLECLSPKEELSRARKLRGGDLELDV